MISNLHEWKEEVLLDRRGRWKRCAWGEITKEFNDSLAKLKEPVALTVPGYPEIERILNLTMLTVEFCESVKDPSADFMAKKRGIYQAILNNLTRSLHVVDRVSTFSDLPSQEIQTRITGLCVTISNIMRTERYLLECEISVSVH
ncbi:MAG: hypothetical protein OQJ98_01780 [Candidatus Pacebacteria bacterium]|nr:hypothetical protein [Candidatus Paceibacterota bacterium]